MSSTVETANEIRPFHVDIPEEDLGASAHSWSKLCPAVGGLAEPDDSGERIKGQFLGARRRRFWVAPLWSASSRGVVSALWEVYSGRCACVAWRWRAVRLLPRRPLTEALIEMAEQRALNRGLRHVVVGAA